MSAKASSSMGETVPSASARSYSAAVMSPWFLGSASFADWSAWPVGAPSVGVTVAVVR
ncbi:hypothetical protein [Streptomyces sp. NRRL B-24572]|uniref:hypothetical protein n=1 Tax=Streptomyces sp. NRRL B-24572 TaxID=1962156 RepID=UPI0015C4F0A3|nr:hypothetical protein [Streptomyces sp. NRRL B-24572]